MNTNSNTSGDRQPDPGSQQQRPSVLGAMMGIAAKGLSTSALHPLLHGTPKRTPAVTLTAIAISLTNRSNRHRQ